MVDIDSALRASAYSGKRSKRGDGNNKEASKKGLEPFDPKVHATKEVADAYSMWLVIVYGLLISVIMRYLFMPTQETMEGIIWLLPVMLTATVPSLHKIIIPKRYSDLYTRGNWFRSSFLFLFSWLALSFLLLNPPLADIASPTLASGIDIEYQDNSAVIGYSWNNDIYEINLNEENVDIVLGMAVRDNVDAENANILVTLNHNSFTNKIILANGSVIQQTEAMDKFNSVENWTRGGATNIQKEYTGFPKVASNIEDVGLAWNLAEELGKDNINLGEYEISIEIMENGKHVEPFGENKWSKTYILKIIQTESI
jgi:cyclophilin family peptidyl-prolyl cis-trans isomerase